MSSIPCASSLACEFVGDFKDGKNAFVAVRTVDEAAFAEKETHGLVKWWNLELKDRSPAWAEKECGIPAAQIVKVARAMGKAAPKAVVWMGPGVEMNPRGTYASMAVYALNGQLGSIDVEGGVWQASSSLTGRFPSSDAYVDAQAAAAAKGKKLDGRGEKDMPAMMNARPGSGVVTSNVAKGLLKELGACKVFISSWSNFNFSCTGAQRRDQASGENAKRVERSNRGKKRKAEMGKLVAGLAPYGYRIDRDAFGGMAVYEPEAGLSK